MSGHNLARSEVQLIIYITELLVRNITSVYTALQSVHTAASGKYLKYLVVKMMGAACPLTVVAVSSQPVTFSPLLTASGPTRTSMEFVPSSSSRRLTRSVSRGSAPPPAPDWALRTSDSTSASLSGLCWGQGPGYVLTTSPSTPNGTGQNS